MVYRTRVRIVARMLHEAGRKAVEKGQVLNKVPNQPFSEWDDLPQRAKKGREIMAAYLLDKRVPARRKMLKKALGF